MNALVKTDLTETADTKANVGEPKRKIIISSHFQKFVAARASEIRG